MLVLILIVALVALLFLASGDSSEGANMQPAPLEVFAPASGRAR